MAEDVGSIYAELRVNLAELRKDINEAKKRFASLKTSVPSPEVRLAIDKLENDIRLAKKRMGEIDKLKVHPPEVKIDIEKLEGEIGVAKKQLKEFGKVEVPTPELRLAMEKLEADIKAARDKKRELGKVKILPAEARLELEGLESDINAYKTKINEIVSKIPPPSTDDAKGAIDGFARGVLDRFDKLGKTATGQFARMFKGLSTAIKAAPIVGAIMLIVGSIKKVAGGINQWLQEGRQAYEAHQIELQKMNAVLQSTGATAWTSTRQLAEQARQLEINSRFAQNEIMAMQSVMLGFRSLSGSVFHEANEAIINMATVMGGDLVSNARRVGQALEDPVDGLRMLGRQGVIFTDTQKALIQSLTEIGDIAAAQRVIIDEMNNSFGGAAAAVAEVTSAQDRYEQAVERLRRAEGALTGEIGRARDIRRANRRERRADRAEAIVAERDARARARSGYEEHVTQLERLRETLADVSDEWDQTALQDQIQRLELELDITQAQDNVVIMERRLGELQRARAGGVMQIQLREEIAAQNELIESIRQQIDQQGELASANANRILHERNEMDQLVEVEERLDDIQRAREQTMREIERAGSAALAAGREEAAVREEMNARALAAWAQQESAVNSLISETESLNITSVRGLAERYRLLTGFNAQMYIAAENVHNLQEAMAGGLPTITGAGFVAQINEIRRVRDFAISAANDQIAHIDQLMLSEEERTRHLEQQVQRRVSAETTANNQILALWEQQTAEGKILIQNNSGAAWTYTREAIQRAQSAMTEMMEEQERVAEAARNAQLQYDAMARASEVLVQQGRERRLEQARLRNDLIEIRDIENEIAMAQLEQAAHFKYLLAGLEENTDEWRAALRLQEQLIESMKALRNAQAQVNLARMAENYETRLRALAMTTRQAAEAQRQLSLQAAEAFRGIDGFDDLIDSINAYYDALKRRDAWQQFVRHAAWATGQVQQLVGAIQTVILNTMRRTTEYQREQLDQRHADIIAALEKEQQARLFAAGLAQAATEAQHAEELARAQMSGDHRLVLEAHQAKQRFEIEQEIAARKLESERATAMERAKIDYEYAKAQWRMQRAQAKLSAAQAILTAAASSPWPWNLIPIGFATGIGAANVAAVYQNRPQFNPPRFASGGIVPGRASQGDTQMIAAQGEEMILTKNMQQNMLDLLRGHVGGGQPIKVYFTLEMDGQPLAETVLDIASRGNTFVRGRAVVR